MQLKEKDVTRGLFGCMSLIGCFCYGLYYELDIQTNLISAIILAIFFLSELYVAKERAINLTIVFLLIILAIICINAREILGKNNSFVPHVLIIQIGQFGIGCSILALAISCFWLFAKKQPWK